MTNAEIVALIDRKIKNDTELLERATDSKMEKQILSEIMDMEKERDEILEKVRLEEEEMDKIF